LVVEELKDVVGLVWQNVLGRVKGLHLVVEVEAS
jgi:hypothetical protein